MVKTPKKNQATYVIVDNAQERINGQTELRDKATEKFGSRYR